MTGRRSAALPTASAPAAPSLRSVRERVLQTLCFEAGGLLLVAPLYAWVSGAPHGESFLLVAVLSVVVMTWSALFNTGFDLLEHRFTGRVASERPQAARAMHAVLHEATAMVMTWPVIVAMTGLGWGPALLADLGLTLAYIGWAYVFNLGFDRWRPVRPRPACSRPAGSR